MQGTVLLIDGVSINRIVLKVQLTAACFQVLQADSVAAAMALTGDNRPDLVLTAITLPDGDAADVKRGLARHPQLANVPVIALSTENDRSTRIKALSAGIDEVLPQPVDEMILQARIRSLLRMRMQDEDLHLREDGPHSLMMPLKDAVSQAPRANTNVALVCHDLQTAQKWKGRLSSQVGYTLRTHTVDAIQELMRSPVPDVIVIELNELSAGLSLRLLADLRARVTTRDCVVIAVPNPADANIAAEALDRGAHDVLHCGFQVEELALRINTQLQYKHRAEMIRDNLRSGLRAAMEDPMTGLYNRRYAKPFLERVVQEADQTGQQFAVMVADLDHFKKINDQYGHPVGDAVLVEAARRLQVALRGCDLLARIGGEEFMVVMPGISSNEVASMAARLCAAINATPFTVAGVAAPIEVTISVGAVVGGHGKPEALVDDLIALADRALYDAKHAGRNRSSIRESGHSAAA
ncbi:diguanylate cyclase [Tritonibacter horizontis]|uniref:diguanylate cyclase n=1 Tax=Tritonibacter horizontis TaxID=1768241 RepID=A0A132BUH9_9RHOB|nr:diguanylate cyclase [Tritonibacter horizontis]KUP92048.1 response regulator PleD [Tritonibacter horizontis]